jgi:RND family efflux transporter MFP subunit
MQLLLRPTARAASAEGAPANEHRKLMKSLLARSWKWLLLLIVVGAVIFRVKFAPVPVIAHSVAAATVVGETMGTGTLEARLTASISPKITGRLSAVLVDQGDAVTAGQVLATFDDAEAQRPLEVAEAALAAAAATVERVRTEETRAQAVLEQARLEHARAVSLADDQTVSESERDKAVEKLNIAEAEAARARAMIAEAESMHASARSQVALQQELLANTRLLAPFDGVVIRRDRDPGSVVAPGGAVLQLVATDEIWVSAWVDETAIAQLAAEQPARIIFRSEPDTPYPGRVARLGRETDRETREFLVDVRVERLPANWTIGQRAEVFLETGRRADVVAVPATFLVHREGRAGVFVLRSGRAHWQPVTMGLRGSSLVEIRDGLTAGDHVVLAAQPGTELQGRRVSVR